MIHTGDIERIIREYDRIVLRNTTDEYDAIAAVRDDTDNEVPWEVIETAQALGYDIEDDDDSTDFDLLFAAAREYQEALRTHGGLGFGWVR